MNELLNKILYLVPDAKVCIKDKNADEDESASKEIIIGDFKVVWNCSNSSPCPTKTAINDVDQEVANAAAIERQKNERDELYANNANAIIGYNIAKSQNLDLTFSEYLDNLGL